MAKVFRDGTENFGIIISQGYRSKKQLSVKQSLEEEAHLDLVCLVEIMGDLPRVYLGH